MDILLGGLGLERFKLQNPFAVANFIIDMAIEKDKPVTNLKLQKIMFFLQGYCLSKYKTPLIDGRFSKWRYGPVEEEVYGDFKYYGPAPIENKSIYFNKEKIEFYSEEVNLPNEFKKILQEVISKMLDVETWKLSEIVLSHSSWKDFKDEICAYKAKDYTNEEIKACFVDNKSELGVNRTMEIVKSLSSNKIVEAGDVIRILFTDDENGEESFVERKEDYVMVVHDPGAGKYHLVDLSNGTIVFSIDFDKDICDELNTRVDTWEVVDAELNVSK